MSNDNDRDLTTGEGDTTVTDGADTEAADVVATAIDEATEPTTTPEAAVESSEAPVSEDEGGDTAVSEPAPETEATSADADAEEKPARPRPRGDRPAISAPKSIGDVPDELSADAFAAAVEQTVFEFKEGDIVVGTVVRVDPDEVLVDIGYKSEGVIPPNELSVRNNANPDDVVEVGQEIETLVLQKEDDQGRLVLSKKRAQYERAWGRIEGVMNDGGTVTGHVIEVVKGGLIVDIGLRGFLPASLVDLRRVRDLQPFVGEPIEAKVIELDRNRNNVVLSRRAYLEEEQAEQRQAFLEDLKEGDIRQGVVSSVVNFGAFVDLGGMDGLVHVSELSWRHVNHPGEIVTVGDQVKVKVLEVDYDRERISLSIRQTAEDPWETFARATDVGAIVPGKVTKTVPFGAFVAVGDGVEGLVHVSEIAMHHVESPELELSLGQEVTVKVTEIDADRRRVSLSIKQALPEWEERSSWGDEQPSRPRRREFQREEETEEASTFAADSSLEAILAELKERGIGRS
ncbi:MAG: 30S ribosomal protein S1 [Acidimicrobiia bacterium]|nr:30S ribosomal protein S1 [Acidimicrobiia bacterium]